MQRKWIGRSEGATLRFRIEGLGESQDDRLTVFTTRPDTPFGASFCALAANHPLAVALAATDPSPAAFVAAVTRLGPREQPIATAVKRGFDTERKSRGQARR